MSGNKEGAEKAVAANKAKYGEDYYSKIGAYGGTLGHTGGYASKKIGPDGLSGIERAKLLAKQRKENKNKNVDLEKNNQ